MLSGPSMRWLEALPLLSTGHFLAAVKTADERRTSHQEATAEQSGALRPLAARSKNHRGHHQNHYHHHHHLELKPEVSTRAAEEALDAAKKIHSLAHSGTHKDSADVIANMDMDAYVISKPVLYKRTEGLLQKLGFRPHRVDPVEVNSSCNGPGAYERGVHGCYLAHQSVWSKILQSGESALVLESDAVTGGASIQELRQRLEVSVADVRSSGSPRYISVGHCGHMCTLAYFMNPKAAKLGTKHDFCSIPDRRKRAIDNVIASKMCKEDHARCTWERGLPDVLPCASCFGEGLFFQDRKLHGMHANDRKQTHIRDGEMRETFLVESTES